MSIGMKPFQALYGYDAPTLVDLVFGERRATKAKDWIVESQEILKLLKENLQTTQNRQKMSADKHGIEHNFEVGDLVFLRVQHYRQSYLKKSGDENLKPIFYGPYRIMHRVGEVAYELDIP
jgi:exosome complex RNA-binding protein Rrp4